MLVERNSSRARLGGMWGYPSSALELTDAQNMLPPSHGAFTQPEEPRHRPKAKAFSAGEDGTGTGTQHCPAAGEGPWHHGLGAESQGRCPHPAHSQAQQDTALLLPSQKLFWGGEPLCHAASRSSNGISFLSVQNHYRSHIFLSGKFHLHMQMISKYTAPLIWSVIT